MSGRGDREKADVPGRDGAGGRKGALRIMDALSGVDEELLERCEQSGQKSDKAYRRPLWQQARAWAAVLCLAVVGAASFGGYRLMQMGGMGSIADGSADEAWPMETIERAVNGETMEEEEGAAQDAAGPDGNEAPEQKEEKGEDKEQLQENVNEAEKGSAQMTGGAADQGVRQEMSADMEGCPPQRSQKLTEAEARSAEGLGIYVPTALPRGYAFESSSRNLDRQEENLTLCWFRGMDSILLSIEEADPVPATVDIARAEIYDVRLYEIPYGETVPEEYREVFQDPVFAVEDLSLEVIESRMASYNDSGDTDTPRGNFRVLYPDGVLVRFNGRGTPEEIWEMFCSMGE
ncbi:MAG: hypothetical protein HFH92_10495 [Lachnospiraceae bacterium]|uniref:hypothetical protein n=1 Tax=uncultured Acetatifactor sp. TaxID=1671927 RepID=UPI00260D6F3D|nr:hypothetical protein [uncultured Acetatifactor sp.]MCI8789520.1 hypothetical protein [Lachnospiraceae bacterium]